MAFERGGQRVLRQRRKVLQHVNGVVVFDPVADRNGPILRRACPDDNLVNARIDDLPLAHRTAHRVGKQLIGSRIPPDEINGGADHIAPGSGDDGVCLRMDAAAEFVPLTGGNMQRLARADAQIAAVPAAAGRPVVAGGNNFVVADNNGAVFAPKAGGTLQNGIGNIKVIILLTRALLQLY